MTDFTTPTEEPDALSIREPGSGSGDGTETATRRYGLMIGLVAGIVGLTAAVAFAAVILLGGNSEEDAARGFLDALESEDLLGLGEMMLPGERAIYFEPTLDMIAEAERLGIVDDVELAAVQGIDLQFEDLVFEVESLADDLAWVAIDGTFTMSAEFEDLPLGSLLERYLPPDWADEIESESESAILGDEFGLAVVGYDGTWYVSLAHTIGEIARRDADLEFPESPALAEPTGAATPEEAMERALLAVADVDLRGLIDVLDPDDTEALRRYSALFMDDWDASVAEFHQTLSEAGVTYSVDEVIAGSEQRDDATVAWIDSVPKFSLVMDVPDIGGRMLIELDDGCLRVLMPETLLEALETAMPDLGIDTTEFDGTTCIDQESLGGAFTEGEEMSIEDDLVLGMPVIGPLLERWTTSFENMADAEAAAVQFHMTERGGRWFVSPLRTLHRWSLAGIQTLDEALLTEVLDEIQYAAEHPEEFEQEMLGYIEELAPALGVPMYGPDLLGPYAEMPLIFLVGAEDVEAVAGDIEARFGDDIVLEVIASADLHAIFLEELGPDSVAFWTPEDFPSGISVAPLDVGTLVEIFNWTEIVDLIPTWILGLPSI